jgi:hypothetical protein
LEDVDPNFLSQYIVMRTEGQSTHTKSVIGERPQDKNLMQTLQELREQMINQKNHQEVHRIFGIVADMTRKEWAKIGGLDFARVMIDAVLDKLHSPTYATNNIVKREKVLELCKCMCISYAVWYGLSAKEVRYLQRDPVSGEFVGFNPRVLLDGILPKLVITKEMVEDALSLLSCLWE